MTGRSRLAALALSAALAACGDEAAPEPTLLLSEPSAVAVFRGVTPKNPGVHPYLVIANAGASDLAVLDAVDGNIVPAPTPVPLRTRVYPVAGHPVLLASASLGDEDDLPSTTADDKPDLLVAVSAGDSALQVLRTWAPDGAVVRSIDLGSDILAIVAVPSATPGTARIAAALAGQGLAVVTFDRAGTDDGAIDVASPEIATVSGLGFQPIALAATPGNPTRVWAASRDELPAGVSGVAGVDVSSITGPPSVAEQMNARAPTRLVAAALLAEATGSAELGATAFEGIAAEERVYAVLDESGCGLSGPIACGLVALDPATAALDIDPTPAGPFNTGFRAPIPLPGSALALGAALPPIQPPSAAEPQFADTTMRMQTAAGARATTAVAGVASTDGALYFVDLGRWELPDGGQPTATVASADPAVTATVAVTAGYTPTARWTATYQGELPGLSSRRAEVGAGTSVAFQAPGGAGDVVRLVDPALGVRVDDVVSIVDPSVAGTCASFDALVEDVRIAADGQPGGAVLLKRDPARPEWDGCVTGLLAGKTGLRATIRAGGWLLTRTIGTSVVQAGRPAQGSEHLVQWQDESGLSCPPTCGSWATAAACRSGCEDLLLRRLARRIGYVAPLATTAGPALALTLAPGSPPARGTAVTIETTEGRTPFRAVVTAGIAVQPRAALPFDRSPWAPADGVRFYVPYAGGVVLDATPTLSGGSPKSLR